MSAFAAVADPLLRQACWQQARPSVPHRTGSCRRRSFAAPRACLERRLRDFATNRHEKCDLAWPCQSAHFCTPDRRESSWSYGICALVPCTFLLENCILVKLHGLCCLPIGQCVRCCGTAWYWSLIHMIIHKPCTPFVDTESGGAEVLPHYRLFLRGASCGWERKPCLEATFQCRRLPLYHGVSR